MIRKIVGVIFAILAFLAQTCLSDMIDIGGIKPNLVIIIVISWGFINGKKSGIYMGFFCGMLIDLFYGINGTIGLNALIYMYLGYANGMLHEIFYGDDIKFPIFIIAVADFLYSFLYYILMFLLRRKLDVGFYIKRIIIPEVIYTTLVAVFVYYLLFVICKRINSHFKNNED